MQSVAAVVTNYITCNETIEYIDNVAGAYPELRIIVVDNGTPEEKLTELIRKCEENPAISLHKTGKNISYAKAQNVGIDVALGENFNYILSCNNDVLLKSENVLEALVKSMNHQEAALIGPNIVNLNGDKQNPFMSERPSEKVFRKMLQDKSLLWILTRKLRKNLSQKTKMKIRQLLGRPAITPETPTEELSAGYVYSLAGAFMMFGPRFFKHFRGFDPRTIFYAEELVLGEMLISKGLKAYYEPSVTVLHKEDRTTSIIWGKETSLRPQLYARKSLKVWKKWWTENSKSKT